MELTLKVLSGRNAGQVVRVPVPKFLIGRSDDCHLRPHSDLISRHHCAILIDNGVVAIRDFNSKNGTFVNGEKVIGQTALKTGDKVSVGQLVFEIHASHGDPIQRRPKVKDVRDAAARVVTGGPRDEDTDVAQWLMDETTVVGASETKTNDHTKTQHFAASELTEAASLEAASLEAADPVSSNGAEELATVAVAKTSDSKAGVAAKKGPGKLPPIPAVATKDSREAATEMLKKILRNR